MRELYGMEHNHGATRDHLIRSSMVAPGPPGPQVYSGDDASLTLNRALQIGSNNIATAAGFPLTEQER